jgi:hypothetical protein
MARILLLHNRLQTTIVLLMSIVIIWGVVNTIRGQTGSGLRAAVAIGAWLIGAEALLGIILWFNGFRPGGGAMHLIYGALGAGLLPATLVATRNGHGRRTAGVITFIAVLVLGIAIRAYVTGI